LSPKQVPELDFASRMNHSRPLLSVIVPVYQGAQLLPDALAAITASDLPRECWELVVVDDASTDGSAERAAAFADTVVRLTGRPRGPAYARNRGFELSRGEIVVFVDADVCIRKDVLARFAKRFADPTVGAVVGSYTLGTPTSGILSQYRNLSHRFLRLCSTPDVDFFWPACGAIRRHEFAAVGMFDEWHYWRPQAEGAELGQRITGAGQRIMLDTMIQAVHLRRWTLRSFVGTYGVALAMPWLRLLLQERSLVSSKTPNLSNREKVSTGVAWVAAVLLGLAALGNDNRWLALGAWAVLSFLLLSVPFLTFASRERGVLVAIRVIPLHFVHYLLAGASFGLAWLLHHIVGEPQRHATDEAFSELGIKTWPPIPQRRPTGAWRPRTSD
jgi:glycosyltransferase involved in cell wall biosynthesis